MDDPSAQVRVFLPTYRRRNLLPRALASLRAQTISNWVCELHNDDPADPFPSILLNELADPRIQLVTHEQNLGGIATFNLFYKPTNEPFYALLEDDNTWEPQFLERMLATLNAHPEATLAWCNQRIAHEEKSGEVSLTSEIVNPNTETLDAAQPTVWGDFKQVMGARHANGAMLIRSSPEKKFPTPDVPFGCVEAFRERMLPHPLIYVPVPLATFTVTQTTARRHDRKAWGAAQVLLAASFLKHAQLGDKQLHQLCAHFREQTPPMTNELLAASFVCAECHPIRRHLTWRDWSRFILQLIRHPIAWRQTLRARSLHPDWWDFLDQHTAARFGRKPTAG